MVGYVYRVIYGGLGNQLFQILSLYAYSKKYKLIPVIPQEKESSSIFGNRPTYWDTLLSKIKILNNLPEGIQQKICYKEPCFSYREIPSPQALGAREDFIIELSGYFQSEKYLDRDEILTLVTPPEKDMRYLEEKYKPLITDQTCVIHIRRGDYLLLQHCHPIPSIGYYEMGIKMMKSHGVDNFIISTDDITWVKEQSLFQSDKMRIISEVSDYLEMWIFTYCKFFILANSTFGWWGAWLSQKNDKKVIVPYQWFGPTGPQDYHSIWCEGWTALKY